MAEGGGLELDLPLPPRDLSPNRPRTHWAVVHRARKAYRGDLKLLLLNAPDITIDPAKAEITYRVCRKKPHPLDDSYRPHDKDNAIASLKPLIDELKAQGFIVDDRMEHFDMSLSLVKVGSFEEEGVHVSLRVWELEE